MKISEEELEGIKKRIGQQVLDYTGDKYEIPVEIKDALLNSPSVMLLERLMAFRVSPWFYEIRAALKRIEEGSFGQCMICKDEISTEVLHHTPTTRVCRQCIRSLRERGFKI